MSVWNTVKSWATQHGQQLVYARIPPHRSDVPAGAPVRPHEGYVRLFLSDMFLSKSRSWFTDYHPCVSARVKLDLEGKPGASIHQVARPPEGMLGPGVRVNHPLTDLLPYSGNTVEIEAALLALKGTRHLSAALGALEMLSHLVPGPIGAAMGVAEMVAGGVDKLLADGDGAVHLGLHDSFGAAGSPLCSGYLAVILATSAQVPPASLGVAQSRLHTQAPDGRWSLLHGFDHMLFYVETRETRDDWRLPVIQEALRKATEVALHGAGPATDAYRKAAVIAALTCKELTPLDRRRVAQAVKVELDSLGEVQSFGDDEDHSLEALAARSPTTGVPSEEELLA